MTTSPLTSKTEPDTRTKEAKAEALIVEAGKLFSGETVAGQSRMDNLIEVGRKLLEAADMLSDYGFRTKIDSGRQAQTLPFSVDSARRYLLFARHASALKAAGVTTVKEADRLSREREIAADQQRAQMVARRTAEAAARIAQNEQRIFNEMRRLPDDEQ